MKNILIVAYAYIAAVIGAGFASGREILCYFAAFGRNGIVGAAISAAVFAAFAAIVMHTCRVRGIRDFSEFAAMLPGRRTPLALRLLTGIFSFAVLSVMVSALCAGCARAAAVPERAAASLVCAACFFLLYRRASGAVSLNGILGIFLVLGIAFCCFYILRCREFHAFAQAGAVTENALVYSGYNLIPVLPVLVILSRRLKGAAETAAAALISGAVLLVLMSAMFAILSIYSGRIDLGEFPMLTMAARQGRALAGLYAVLLAMSVITTLIAAAESVSEAFLLRGKALPAVSAAAAAYLTSSLGFGRLINTAYRICGIIGFILCVFVSVCCVKIMRDKK